MSRHSRTPLARASEGLRERVAWSGLSASATAAEIVFDRATKRYPGRPQPAVTELSLTIPAGEICVLVGPSGGGKTTAMKMVNRLISITEGDIRIDGTSVRSLDVTELRRGIGYVIQQVGLFPHLSVGDNIGTVPRLLGWPKSRIRERAAELLELVGLEADYATRYPAQLSGGQRQRVGLARALAANPPLMLMDEPFGAIDPITRARLQDEFLRLHREIRKTVIFVTHDIDEAIKMGDRIAILHDGGILAQYDTPDEILANPADEFVERFVGADRGLKRLALRSVRDVELDHAAAASAGAPRTAASTTLRDALSLMLTEGAHEVVVVDEAGEPIGALSLQRVSDLLREQVTA
jgi:osmoprotectant transport system ATP-binding protein